MGIRKFGDHADGRVTGVDDEDPQGISKSAVTGETAREARQTSGGEWTEQDAQDLREENQR